MKIAYADCVFNCEAHVFLQPGLLVKRLDESLRSSSASTAA